MFDLEYSQGQFIAGCDEVGRGPLAGPVVGCCVYASTNDNKSLLAALTYLKELGVTDSKKLTEKKRIKILNELNVDLSLVGQKVSLIVKNLQITYSIQEVSETLIDEINILNASLLAMKKSYLNCTDNNDGVLLIDGNKELKEMPEGLRMETIVKGDSKSIIIGLASVIAKEYRDNLMKKLGEKYPGYGLESHAGYPTVKHKEAISQLGVTPIHRKSFKGVKEHVV